MMASVCSITVLWAEDLETSLQSELNGMSRRPSDSIKSKTNRLFLESEMHIYQDISCLQFWLLLANSSVMWTKFPDALRVSYFVDVKLGWSIVFHSLCEMSFMSEAVSNCNQKEWSFSFTDTYFLFYWSWGEQLLADWVFSFSICVWYEVACVLFCVLMGAESLFVSLLVAFVAAVRFERIFMSRM